MYNWIAKRWWSARADDVGIYNHPIGPINENTTIKAITIGPWRDSDVATFTTGEELKSPTDPTDVIREEEPPVEQPIGTN